MKKVLFFLFLSVMAISASAQVKFKSVQVAANLRGQNGIGIGTTIALPKNLDVTPTLNLYFPSGFSRFFSIEADIHRDFDLGNEFHVYPLGGLALMNCKTSKEFGSVSATRLGVNLGGGLDYDLSYNWTVFGELKYQLMSDYDHLYTTLGVKYRF